ncbi:MAG TPA: hypothetical protein VFU17_08570 [Candidatus Limnocylindrales bacterium]|nr:hypothetical protein [Candidatus Limnocylindrales bacterium]
MRDEDLTTPASPQQMTLGAETDVPPADVTPEKAQAAELSRAAREAVRHTDPRIDRQLARMGLADPEEEAGDAPVRPQVRVVRPEDMDRLAEDVSAARVAVARANQRVNLLTWVVTAEGIAVAVLALLLLFR